MIPLWFLVAVSIANAWRKVNSWTIALFRHPKSALQVIWAGFWSSWIAVGTVVTIMYGFSLVPSFTGFGISKDLFIVANLLLFARCCIAEELHGKKGERKVAGERISIVVIVFLILGGFSFIECGMVANNERGNPATARSIWAASFWWKQVKAPTLPSQITADPQPAVQQPSSSEALPSVLNNRPQPPVREPLDVRGDKLCHDILDFSKVAAQEEPPYVVDRGTSPDANNQLELIRRNILAHIRTDFDSHFGGQLTSITREFAAKGIVPNEQMDRQNPSSYEIEIGGRSLCGMVYELRQKEGIPDPHKAEQAEKSENFKQFGPCLGTPVSDDPFPAEHADQVGTRAIDMGNKLQQKADDCVNTMRVNGGNGDPTRAAFALDIQRCCLQDIKNIHYSILSRCPTARESRGELLFSIFVKEITSTTPSCNGDEVAKYIRELGQTMKDVREWGH